MKWILFTALFIISRTSSAQADTSEWLRAFPITDYMVPLNDSTVVVQLEMPEDLVLKEKQLGLMYGVYHRSLDEAVQKGHGKCYLIKTVYYYFAISQNKSGHPLKKGDLLYTFLPRSDIYYGQVVRLASHFIRLQNVHGDNFYDRYTIFHKWSEADEEKLIDSLVADIQFTGQYFLENDPSVNKVIKGGEFRGSQVLEVMAECRPQYVKDFLGYMIARPRLYAGREWKISEIFATWLTEGAPTVVK